MKESEQVHAAVAERGGEKERDEVWKVAAAAAPQGEKKKEVKGWVDGIFNARCSYSI